MELWRDQVGTFLQKMREQDVDLQDTPRLRVKCAKASKEKSPCFPAIRRLGANENTEFEYLSDACSTSLCLPETFPSSLYIRDYNIFSTTLPGCINLVGVVGEVLPETETKKGDPIQNFSLLDGHGNAVSCVAFGRHAGSYCIASKNEIVCFFGRGSKGLGQNPSQLWFYEDAHIVKLGINECSIPLRKHIMMVQ